MTAEFVVALPAAIAVVVLTVGALQLSALQVRAQSAASMAARSIARGEAGRDIRVHLVAEMNGAAMRSRTQGDLVCVDVSVQPLQWLPIHVSATGCALGAGW